MPTGARPGEALCPKNTIGCKWLCVDSGYYETFNAPHVALIDVAEQGIERITPPVGYARREGNTRPMPSSLPLGLAVAGFPNLFTITGPGSPSVLTIMLPSIEQHVDWIADLLAYTRTHRLRLVEARADAQEQWMAHVGEVAGRTLRYTCSSWYLGANVAGKPRVFMPYIGGFPRYVERCNQIAANGYEGFLFHA